MGAYPNISAGQGVACQSLQTEDVAMARTLSYFDLDGPDAVISSESSAACQRAT